MAARLSPPRNNMAITDTVKRAPKWAWWTVGGIGLGAVALTFYNNRDAPEKEERLPGEDDLYAGGIGAASPAYGVVTPTIVPVQGSADPTGLLDSMVTGIDTLITTTGAFWKEVWGPVQDQNENILAGLYGQTQTLTGILGDLLGQQQATIGAIATAGPAPAPYQAPPPVSTPAPPPPQAPASQPRVPIRDEWITRTRSNERGNVWCNCIHVKQYAGEGPMVVNEKKVANGRCWAENHPCSP